MRSMDVNEIREWAAIRPKQGTKEYGFVRRSRLESMIDTLLAALDEKEERLAIKDDALCAATMVGEFAISKLKVATEAIPRAVLMLEVAADYAEKWPEEIIYYDEADCDGYCVADDCRSAAAALKEIEKEGG